MSNVVVRNSKKINTTLLIFSGLFVFYVIMKRLTH